MKEKNEIVYQKFSGFRIFVRQLKNPLLFLLLSATTVSFIVGEKTDAVIILSMVVISIFLGFVNEFSAEKTVANLLNKISLTAIVLRHGQKIEIPVRDIEIGDTVFLSTGSIVPADIKLLKATHLEINESTLTGESHPVNRSLGEQVFMGTTIINGEAEGVVVTIGRHTKFGQIGASLSQVRPETGFERGMSSFSMLLVKTITIMCVSIFVINFLLGHQPVSSLLFSLAIAIGLTPELFPVIISVSLAQGGKRLAKKHVVVRQMVAIENLGNMDILCSDKTGTITEGKISLHGFVNLEGQTNSRVFERALICNIEGAKDRFNINNIDSAIWDHANLHHLTITDKFTEVYKNPFDYRHQAMFTVIQEGNAHIFIMKGAPEKILSHCRLKTVDKNKAQKLFEKFSQDGLRVIAIAEKKTIHQDEYTFQDGRGLTLLGFLTFRDKPKKEAGRAFDRLKELGVTIKIITGDNELVTTKICSEIGLPAYTHLLGSDIEKMTQPELENEIENYDFFARVSPDQKLRIITALKTRKHIVGFMGDGINDAPALNTADVGISVNTAVDVAKDAANVVLLKKDLDVLANGIQEGRKIFANTMKYILMGASSNFGNMFSAAGASFFLPFLPMAASQILFTNLLYDVSQLAVPTDNVDNEAVIKPHQWDINFIKRQMLIFGPISAVFDFATFGIMIFLFKANESLFQTGWFIESLITQTLVIFIIRTNKIPFFSSKPSLYLTISSLTIVTFGVLFAISPYGKLLGFVTPPTMYFFVLVAFTTVYLTIVEVAKKYVRNL